MKFDVTVARRGVDIHKWLQRNNLLEVELSGDKGGSGTGSGSGSEYTCECVGFDVEWKPSWRKGQARNSTALLQLGTLSSALLVQLKHFAPVDKRDLEDALMATPHYSSEEVSERRGRDKGSVRSKRREKLPASILRLLASERVVKVGVGVLEDLSKLQDDFGTPIGAFRDVGLTAHRALGLEKFGLVGLTSHCFGVELHKPKSVSRSDWERSELSNNQIHYAALDAIVSRYIFSALEEKKIISEVEDKNAEALMLRELQREGPSRRCFRRAVLAAAENNFLFASLHSFIREEELQPHGGSVATLSRLQDLKTYCERVNTSAEVKVVLRAASCVMISVFLNGVTVKSYCVGGGVLLKKDKKLLENKLCEEVLSDLMILQRNCTGNLTYSLLSIFAGVPVHKLPIHQLQESGSRQPQISSAVASTGTISAQDNSSVIPSYVRAYCRQHSSRVVI